MSSGLYELRQDIGKLRQRTFDQRYYVDPKSLRGLCTARRIKDAVYDCSFPSHERDQIIDAIVAKGTITFCILVHKYNELLMTKFLDYDLHNTLDSRLPLDKKSIRGIPEEATNDFFEAQWEFRPVILARNRYMQIDDECVLPFVHDDHDGTRDGSFGDIHTVVINSSMQDLIVTEVSYLIHFFGSQLIAKV